MEENQATQKELEENLSNLETTWKGLKPFGVNMKKLVMDMYGLECYWQRSRTFPSPMIAKLVNLENAWANSDEIEQIWTNLDELKVSLDGFGRELDFFVQTSASLKETLTNLDNLRQTLTNLNKLEWNLDKLERTRKWLQQFGTNMCKLVEDIDKLEEILDRFGMLGNLTKVDWAHLKSTWANLDKLRDTWTSLDKLKESLAGFERELDFFVGTLASLKGTLANLDNLRQTLINLDELEESLGEIGREFGWTGMGLLRWVLKQ